VREYTTAAAPPSAVMRSGEQRSPQFERNQLGVSALVISGFIESDFRIKSPEWSSLGPLLRALSCWGWRTGGLVKASIRCLLMIYRDLEVRGGSRQYSRWPYPWSPEDEWGPLTAAVMFLIILAALLVYGTVQL
jgi:hypothetical protein